MATALLAAAPWARRRARAGELGSRWPFAAGVLGFYARLLAVQETAYRAVLSARPRRDQIAAHAAAEVMPRIVELSVAHGPPALAAAVLERVDAVDFTALVQGWLHAQEQTPVDTFMARAAAAPILEALGPAAFAAPAARDDRHCPACGGPPQLSYFAASREDLVTPHRYLECARCAAAWPFARMTCAACGEAEAAKLVVYAELGTTQAERSGSIIKPRAQASVASTPPVTAHFPHLRVDGCTTCARYLIGIDLERDGRAVPVVDELAAIPLDLYAEERGLRKIVPNVMGF